jgi:hypothetical protein
MKLVWRKNKPVLMVAPNFTIVLQPSSLKYIDVNGSKYAVVIIAGEPIHIEPLEPSQ